MLRFLLLVIQICSGTLLPKPSGPCQLTLNVSQLIETSRKDPWGMDPTTYRRLMISRFDPVPPHTCYGEEKVPYMSPAISLAEDAAFAPYGIPAGIFASLEMAFCSQPKSCEPNETYPVVLFSPGLDTTRLLYSMLAQEIASQGFTVITLDHPFDTDIVEFPDGFIADGGKVNSSDINSINHALDIRTNDISFVLNTLGFQYDATPNASALILAIPWAKLQLQRGCLTKLDFVAV